MKKKTDVRVAFGKRLRKKRKDFDMSQKILGELSGLHDTYVGSVERGERNISLEAIVALARALCCEPKDLM